MTNCRGHTDMGPVVWVVEERIKLKRGVYAWEPCSAHVELDAAEDARLECESFSGGVWRVTEYAPQRKGRK
jgi:hypothetical protein